MRAAEGHGQAGHRTACRMAARFAGSAAVTENNHPFSNSLDIDPEALFKDADKSTRVVHPENSAQSL
jgi:hypothetical protein